MNRWINIITSLVATQLNLFASRRLLMETLQPLFRSNRSLGTWTTVSQWIHVIDKVRADPLSRQGGYREAALFALRTLYSELGSSIDYAASDFFERIFATPGCFIIRTGGLSVESASFLASLFANWIYESRGVPGRAPGHPVLFVMDDALPLIKGNTASESEGATSNPLATWSFMGRSRGIGFAIAAQNYSLVSPAFRNNAATVMAFGSYGRDAEEISRDLNLTSEQSTVLPLLQPGQVVAISRPVWPVPVMGRIPEVR